MKASAHHGAVFLALCGMTAFWGSAAWAADAGQTLAPVQDGIHYFSVKTVTATGITIMTALSGTIPWPSAPGLMPMGPWAPRPWATMP